MKRKQKKSLPWRTFGYVILIIIKFCKLLLWISRRIINALRSYIKHSKECFIRYPNTWKLVQKNSVAPHFFNPLLSVWICDETLFVVLKYCQVSDVQVGCEDQLFCEFNTVLRQIIHWFFEEVIADWMHFSFNLFLNLIYTYDLPFPWQYTSGLCLSNLLF